MRPDSWLESVPPEEQARQARCLDDWLALTVTERKARQARWQGRQSPDMDPMAFEWQALLEEAARRFCRQFRNHPDVVRVDYSAWFADEYPPCISVATYLRRGHLIPEMSSEFLTFAVVQEP